MRRTLRGLMAAPSGPFSEYAPTAAGIKPNSSPQSSWSSPRPESLAFRQISRPRLTFREQLVGRFVQTLLLAASIRQMTNWVAIQLVNVRTLKIVKLSTFEAKDRVAPDHADMDAFAVLNILPSTTDLLSRCPTAKAALVGRRWRDKSHSGYFPFAFNPSSTSAGSNQSAN